TNDRVEQRPDRHVVTWSCDGPFPVRRSAAAKARARTTRAAVPPPPPPSSSPPPALELELELRGLQMGVRHAGLSRPVYPRTATRLASLFGYTVKETPDYSHPATADASLLNHYNHHEEQATCEIEPIEFVGTMRQFAYSRDLTASGAQLTKAREPKRASRRTDDSFRFRRMEADPMSQTALRIRGMLNNAYHVERPKPTMERSVEDEGRIAILLLTVFTHRDAKLFLVLLSTTAGLGAV
ncbi:hypothetical protein ALC62_08819, partial [Cyphomyrmex costatus]